MCVCLYAPLTPYHSVWSVCPASFYRMVEWRNLKNKQEEYISVWNREQQLQIKSQNKQKNNNNIIKKLNYKNRESVTWCFRSALKNRFMYRLTAFRDTQPCQPLDRWTWSMRGDPHYRGRSLSWSEGCSYLCRQTEGRR